MDDVAEWQPERLCIIGGRVRCGAVVLIGGRTLTCHEAPDHAGIMHGERGFCWP